MNEILDIQEEVNRKALGALGQIEIDRQNGTVDKNSTRYAIATLFNAVSGIASNEVFELISEMSSKVHETAAQRVIRLFLKDSEAVTVSRVPGDDKVLLRKFLVGGREEGGEPKETRKAFGQSAVPSKAAADYFESVCAALTIRGYVEL